MALFFLEMGFKDAKSRSDINISIKSFWKQTAEQKLSKFKRSHLSSTTVETSTTVMKTPEAGIAGGLHS